MDVPKPVPIVGSSKARQSVIVTGSFSPCVFVGAEWRGFGGEVESERGPAAARMTAKTARSVTRLAAEVVEEGGIVWG